MIEGNSDLKTRAYKEAAEKACSQLKKANSVVNSYSCVHLCANLCGYTEICSLSSATMSEFY